MIYVSGSAKRGFLHEIIRHIVAWDERVRKPHRGIYTLIPRIQRA
jgi:hypothetical protein